MSFILDALRKSETARRRSEAPDLFTTMPNTAAPAPARAQWPMLVIGGVGVLSLIVALWLFAQRAPSPTAPAVEAATAPETNAPPPQESSPPPSNVGTMPAPVPDTAPAEPPVAPATAPPLPAPRVSPPAPAPTTSPNTPEIDHSRDLPAPPEPVSPPAHTPMPAGDRIVSLADLDPGTRKQLPPLKLSMHLWNETPSQRFVILDGQRLKEGDVLGEVVVERITRDGAVLAWRDSRLKIELR